MHKRILIALVLILIGVLVVSIMPACTPATTSGEVELELFTTAAGTSAYVLANATADILNKHHPYLRGSVVEVVADWERLEIVDKYPDERKGRAYTGFITTEVEKFRKGLPPYKKKWLDQRVLYRYQSLAQSFITYDSNIKTPQDLIGKKVGLWPVGHTMTGVGEDILKAWGIYDKVKISNHRPTAFKDALSTGVIDTAFISMVPWSDTNMPLSPFSDELMRAKKSYWISITEQDIATLNKSAFYTAGHTLVPKDFWGPGYPDKDTGFVTLHICVWPHKLMKDQVAYDLTKFFDEYISQHLNEYMAVIKPGDLSGKNMVKEPLINKENTHPGAWKYYKEKGYK